MVTFKGTDPSSPSTMSIDDGIALNNWVKDETQRVGDLFHVLPRLIANLFTALGFQEGMRFIYHNGNDPTLGKCYLDKVTGLLLAHGDVNAALQLLMKAFAEAFGVPNGGNDYETVNQYEQSVDSSRMEKYAFGKVFDGGIDITEQYCNGITNIGGKLGSAFDSLKKKAARRAATATGGGDPAPHHPGMPPYPQGGAPQVMTGMPTPGYSGMPVNTPNSGYYGQMPPTMQQQLPTPTHNHAFNGASPVGHPRSDGMMYGQPTMPSTPQQQPPTNHAFNFNGVSTHRGLGGGVFGTPTHNPHTIGSMYHTPKGPTGPIYPGNGGKENAVNYTGGGYYASVPPVDALSMGIGGLNIGRPSSSAHQDGYVSSFRGEDASSLGMSTLSMKENNGPKKVENLEKDMHYPDVYEDTMMSKYDMDQFVVEARDNSVFAKNKSSALLTRVQKHDGIAKAEKMLEDQLGIYADEERRCQVGIDKVNCNRKDADTAHKKKMADSNDAEAEEIRKVKVKYDGLRAAEEKDNAKKKREFDEEEEQWEEQKENNKTEKFENLTLAKAKKLSFEIGIEIYSKLAELDERREDNLFLTRIDTCLKLLDQYRECISRIHDNPSDAVDAMNRLKAMVWDDYVTL